MNDLTIKNLESKMWYRGLKVIWILSYVVAFVGLVFTTISEFENSTVDAVKNFIVGFVLVVGLFRLIQHTTYYILLGKWSPPE